MNGKLKVALAVGTIWIAGATSDVFVDKFLTTPADLETLEIRLDRHIDRMTERVGALEARADLSENIAESRFVYLGCMLEAIRTDAPGSRCKIVLTSDDRELITTIIKEDRNGR